MLITIEEVVLLEVFCADVAWFSPQIKAITVIHGIVSQFVVFFCL
jgi:hypothetical protein